MDRANVPATSPQDQAAPNVHPLPVTPKSIDPYIWEHVHADYRTGLTYSHLSEKYDIPIPAIVKRRKDEAWKRDLRKDVQVEVNARLAADSVSCGSRSDEELVQSAATAGAAVVLRHRQALRDGISAAQLLAAQLHLVALGKDAEVGFLGLKETVSDSLLKVANSLARMVPLERTAYGLNVAEDEKPYEDRLREWHAGGTQAKVERKKALAGG
jgi:hypothetical protein